MTRVVDLASAAEVAEVGGKSRNLGVLLRAAFPVPPGFCVTTYAYREVAGHGLSALLDDLATTPADDQPTLHRLARRARDLIEQTPVPAALADEITAAYDALGPDVAVAVRSSATAEDLESASFAGQQDTFLNVVGAEALIEAVRRCWASLWTDRAVSYRAARGIDPAGVALAVVVQRMVDAVAAGVMFTADPVAGTRGHTVIDASPGLGESVVSGAVNPDHLVVDVATGAVIERRIGDKRVAVRPLAGGGTETVELFDRSMEVCLTDDHAAALARLGAAVEDHYGAPQDTEWALDSSGRLWLTQARPITTLYPLLARPDRDDSRVFLCMSLAQGLTRPITPMGLAAFRLIGSSVAAAALDRSPADPFAGPTALQVAGLRPFIDATAALRHPVARRLALAALGVMESRAAVVVRQLVEDPRFAIRPTSPIGLVRGIGRVLVRSRLPLHAALALAAPESAVRRIDRAEARLRSQLSTPSDATAEERLALVEQSLGTDTFLVMPATFGYAIPGFAMLNLSRRLLGERASPTELQTVLRGLPHNVTTDMDLALWRLTEQVRADPASAAAFGVGADELTRSYADRALPAVVQHGLGAFLARYGHRAVAEIDLGMPRWHDDPRHLLGVIRNYLALDDPTLAPTAQFAAGEAKAETVLAELRREGGRPDRAARASARIRARSRSPADRTPGEPEVLARAPVLAAPCAARSRRRGVAASRPSRRGRRCLLRRLRRRSGGTVRHGPATGGRGQSDRVRGRARSAAHPANPAERRDRARGHLATR